MKFSSLIFASVCALTLAACGSETSGDFTTEDGETGEYTIDSESGESSLTVETEGGVVSMRSGAEVPVDLPAGFSLMDGLEVVTNSVVEQAEGRGSLITFQTELAPEAIIEYYRGEVEAAGVEVQIDASVNEGKMLAGENSESGLTFSVTAYPSDEGTTGQLIIGQGVN